MSNLMPELRPDKNGKMVTRHVKPNGGGSLSAASIPGPALTAALNETPGETIARVLRECEYSDMQVEDISHIYLDGKGERTAQVVADALLDARNDREIFAITKVVTIAMEPGVVQLAASDIGFVLDVAEMFPSDKEIFSLRKSIDAMESTFVSTFRPNNRASDHTKTDYLKYSDAFRSHTIARALGIHETPTNVFDAQEQINHIQENLETFSKNLPACAEIVNALYQAGVKVDSTELLKAIGFVEENPSSLDAIVAVASERKRFDVDEIQTVLATSSALSRGAL